MTPAASKPHRRLSIAHLALLIPWVAVVVDAWDPITDNSFLWHVRAGTVQAATGAVLTSDPFSFTMVGTSWRTQSWLAELGYSWLEGRLGLDFVPPMLLVVGTLTFLTIGLIAYRHSDSVPASAFVLVLSTLALISFSVPRPVLFSYLLMSLVVLVWDVPTARWSLPLLVWIWAGIHASFIIGLAYIGLSILMKREWRALPTAMVAAVVTLTTAHGLGVVSFLVDFRQNSDALRYLTEWRAPELLEPVFLPFLGAVVFIVVGAFRGRIYPRHLWLIVPFTLLGLSSVRAIPPAFLALVPLIALSLSGLEIGSRAGLRPRLAMVFALFVVAFPFALAADGLLSEQRFPIEASKRLADLPTFHDDVVGGYLIWSQTPDLGVYIDDRAELYGQRMSEFVDVRSGEVPWEPVFERDGIKQALLRSNERLVSDLAEAGWETVYTDDEFVILRPGL